MEEIDDRILASLSWLNLNVCSITDKSINKESLDTYLNNPIKFNLETALELEIMCEKWKNILANYILRLEAVNQLIIKKGKYEIQGYKINLILPHGYQPHLLDLNFLKIHIHELGPQTYTAMIPVKQDYHWEMMSIQDVEELYNIVFVINGQRIIYYD